MLEIGDYRDDVAMGLPNDAMSSISLGSNVQLDAYADIRFGGQVASFTASASTLPSFNDMASSVKVRWQRSCPFPGADQVVVWEDSVASDASLGAGAGRCSVLRAGLYGDAQTMGIANDSISAIYVGSSMKVTLYQDANFAGNRLDLSASSSNLGTFNDQTSSIRIQWAHNCPDPKPNQAVVFQDINYSGACNVLEMSESYALPDDFGLPNDSISSVKVGGSVSLKIYPDASFAGTPILIGNTPDMRQAAVFDGSTSDWNDSVSSLAVAPRLEGSSQDKPMLFLKCKFADVPDQPNDAYIEDLYMPTGSGTSNLYDYYTDQTYGVFNLRNSVMSGWYTMTINEADCPVSPGFDDRGCVVNNCLTAAGMSPNGYSVVTALVNAPHDDGGTSGNWVLLGANNFCMGCSQHEIGHGFLLQHSRSVSNPNDYQDPWDIMSLWQVDLGSSFYGAQGPGMNAFNRDRLGVVTTARRAQYGGGFGDFVYTLVPLNDATYSGYEFVEIPASVAGYRTLVEYRRNTGMDYMLPASAVFVHQDRGDGHSYLVDGAPGPELTAGEVLTIGPVQLTVGALTTTSATITIHR